MPAKNLERSNVFIIPRFSREDTRIREKTKLLETNLNNAF